jgi:hypothetical protein
MDESIATSVPQQVTAAVGNSRQGAKAPRKHEIYLSTTVSRAILNRFLCAFAPLRETFQLDI